MLKYTTEFCCSVGQVLQKIRLSQELVVKKTKIKMKGESGRLEKGTDRKELCCSPAHTPNGMGVIIRAVVGTENAKQAKTAEGGWRPLGF